jgi:hypothetical protein
MTQVLLVMRLSDSATAQAPRARLRGGHGALCFGQVPLSFAMPSRNSAQLSGAPNLSLHAAFHRQTKK